MPRPTISRGKYKVERTNYLMMVIEMNTPAGILYKAVFTRPKGVSKRQWIKRWNKRLNKVNKNIGK